MAHKKQTRQGVLQSAVQLMMLLLSWDAILQCEKDGSYRGIGRGREARMEEGGGMNVSCMK